MKQLIWVLTLALTLACNSKPKGSFEVAVTLKNTEQLTQLYPGSVRDGKLTVFLYEIPAGPELQPVSLDSVSVPVNQTAFTLQTLKAGDGMFEILVERGPMIPLIYDASTLSVTIDFSNKERFYSVTNSPGSSELQDFIVNYNKNYAAIDQSLRQLDSLKTLNVSDSLQILATNEKNKKMEDLNIYTRTFLNQVKHPAVASFALGQSFQTLPREEFEKELNRLTEKFKTDAGLAKLKKQYENYKIEMAAQEARRKQNSWIGKKAPELVLPDMNGKNIALSSFKGRYVLVDFWASWCGPCRNENPNVVAAYQRFKDKNFTILGVSLDKAKEPWQEAVIADGLTWTHVSDLAYWNSIAVKTFGFDGIPFNVLLDPQGNVIGEGLRGEDLTKKLEEVLK